MIRNEDSIILQVCILGSETKLIRTFCDMTSSKNYVPISLLSKQNKKWLWSRMEHMELMLTDAKVMNDDILELILRPQSEWPLLQDH